jgi:addiction module HigA family antidote
LREEFLKPLGIGVAEFADRIGVTRATVSRIINGRSAVTPTMAMRFGRALGTSYQLWVRLQLSTDLYAAARSPEASAIAKIAKISVAQPVRQSIGTPGEKKRSSAGVRIARDLTGRKSSPRESAASKKSAQRKASAGTRVSGKRIST